MDGTRFDALTRALHALTTRRTTLLAGAGAMLATLLGIESAAACKAQGAKCNKAASCCSKYCRKFSKKEKKCWCRQLGEACSSASNCCRVPSMVCGAVGTICPDGNHCCIPVGGNLCTDDCDCCGEGVRCRNSICEACKADGETCQHSGECCSDDCEEIDAECV